MIPVSPILIRPDDKPKAVTSGLGGFLAPKITVVPRGQCAFKRVRLVNDKATAIKAAKLKSQSQALSPTAEVFLKKDKVGLGASVWVFDREDQFARYLPESLLARPARDTFRLVKCISGYEGQLWVGEDLVASRWWSDVPSQSDWQAFILSIDVPSHIEPPGQIDPVSVPLTNKVPLFVPTREYLAQILPAQRVAGLVCGVSLIAAVLFGSQILRLKIQQNQIASEIAAISENVTESRLLRGRATENLSYYESYAQNASHFEVFAVLEAFRDVLEGQPVLLRSVRINDQTLEIRVVGEFEMSEPEFVESVERSGLLERVRIDSRVRDTVIIKADLVSEGDTAQRPSG